jgi:hypothetical protein
MVANIVSCPSYSLPEHTPFGNPSPFLGTQDHPRGVIPATSSGILQVMQYIEIINLKLTYKIPNSNKLHKQSIPESSRSSRVAWALWSSTV